MLELTLFPCKFILYKSILHYWRPWVKFPVASIKIKYWIFLINNDILKSQLLNLVVTLSGEGFLLFIYKYFLIAYLNEYNYLYSLLDECCTLLRCFGYVFIEKATKVVNLKILEIRSIIETLTKELWKSSDKHVC